MLSQKNEVHLGLPAQIRRGNVCSRGAMLTVGKEPTLRCFGLLISEKGAGWARPIQTSLMSEQSEETGIAILLRCLQHACW
jgi:hypothetical protein